MYQNIDPTNKGEPCSGRLCEVNDVHPRGINSCPYKVTYASERRSSSGVSVGDILYLTTDNSSSEIVEARITFGYVFYFFQNFQLKVVRMGKRHSLSLTVCRCFLQLWTISNWFIPRCCCSKWFVWSWYGENLCSQHFIYRKLDCRFLFNVFWA